MTNRKLNNKGFTLIELLAVIIILGILMIVAIPQVTKYINNSKKDAFGDTALAYINSARYSILNDEYDQPLPAYAGDVVCIGFDYVSVDKGKTSPFGGDISLDKSWVKVANVNGKIVYSVFMIDQKGYATSGEVEESQLSKTSYKRQSIKKFTGTAPGCTTNAVTSFESIS